MILTLDVSHCLGCGWKLSIEMTLWLGCDLHQEFHLATREVRVVGVIPSAHGSWMEQVARNLTDPIDGFLMDCRHVIHDRSPLFTDAFRSILGSSGIEPVRLPPRSPNLNAYAERFVRTIKEGCFHQLILFGERSLRRTLYEFVEDYHKERNHQGMENRILQPDFTRRGQGGGVVCRKRLGGMLNYYYRETA